MTTPWYFHLVWIAAAALLAYALAAVFAMAPRLPRSLYLLADVGLVGLFGLAYLRWSGVALLDRVQFNWVWGLLGAGLLGIFTFYRAAAPGPAGLARIFERVCCGVACGWTDALLLSVLPVLATWSACSALGLTGSWLGLLVVGLLGIWVSLLVAYAGQRGGLVQRGRGPVGAVIGNSAITLGYLLTGSPVGALLSHIAMHLAGVQHAAAAASQLPPHFLP